MDNIYLTVIASVILMGFVIAGLAVGLILTGRSRLKKGCGYTPNREKDKSECSICGNREICEKEEDDERNNNENDRKDRRES